MRRIAFGRWRVVSCCLTLTLAGCRDGGHSGLRRVALLPVNVLVDDAPVWMRSAGPVVLQHDLASAQSVFAVLAENDSEAYKSGAAEAVEVTVDGSGGAYWVSAGVRSLSSQRIEPLTTGAEPLDLITALDRIAKKVDSGAIPFSTKNEDALGSYVSALESKDVAARIRGLSETVREAPDFGAAQIELIASEAQTGSSELSQTVAAARQYRTRFDTLDGLHFDALLAGVLRRPLAEQAAAATAVVKATPNDPEMLASLARDRFLLGDAAGEQFLLRAITLRGKTAALQTELLQGLVETRQFSRAAQMLAQVAQSPAGALEQASCWLLAGDKAKAEAVAAGALKPQNAGDVLAQLRRAEWMAVKGDLAGAASLAGAGQGDSSKETSDAKALGEAQAAIWYLQLGNRAQARQAATASAEASVSAGAKQIAAASLLLASSDTGEQLRARLNAVQAQGAGKDAILAFGLFLYGDYAGAAEVWRAIYAASGESDLQSRILLAACYRRMKGNGNMTALHVLPVLPNLTGADPFSTLTFGEMRLLLQL